MHRFDTLRRGLLAGVLASLVLATFDFVTDGASGNGFPAVLRWFGLTITDPTIGHWAGFLLLIVLGGVFGLIFGALQRGKLISTDFEKGEASGSEAALSIVSQTAHTWRQRETE